LSNYRIVQSRQNSHIKELRQAMARPGRSERGLVAIEGPNLIAEALRAGLRIDTLFVAEGAESLAEELPIASDIERLLLPESLLTAALDTESPQPIAALIEPPLWNPGDLLPPQGIEAPAPLYIVLAGLQDPGNVGTILRSAEAFGATGALLLPGTVSPWNQKAIRASAGSIFRLPLMSASAEELFPRLHQAGIRIFTTAVEGATPAHRAALDTPSAILIGNEGNGVPAEIAALADEAITIPCPGPVESLNASIAASILLYEAATQRRKSVPANSDRKRNAQ